jgi:hypothetical protein
VDALRRMRNLLTSGLRWPVPNYTRSGLYWQATFILICAFRLQWWPVIPGVAVALLAVAACVMAVRADSFTGSEKAIWVAISFALCFVELQTIHKDRNEHDRAEADSRREQKESRDADERSFKALIQRGDELFSTQKEMFGEITGAGSYLYLLPGSPFPLGKGNLCLVRFLRSSDDTRCTVRL